MGHCDADARYRAMVEAGESPRMAEVLAYRAFPGLKTDSVFNRGRCNGNQFAQSPWLGDYYRGVAEGRGVSTTGKTYLAQLAEFPGDPMAWVSNRGDVERVCRERGYSCDGAVTVKECRDPLDEGPSVRVARDLIDSEVESILADAPGSDREAVEARVRELREGRVDDHAPLVDWESMPDLPEIYGEADQ